MLGTKNQSPLPLLSRGVNILKMSVGIKEAYPSLPLFHGTVEQVTTVMKLLVCTPSALLHDEGRDF